MADLQFTVSALDKATAALLKVAAQLDKVGSKLDKLDGKVAKITAALDDKASPGLDNIDRKVKSIDGKKATVKVDVDKSLGDSLIKISLLGRALKAIALPAAAIAAAPQIAAIGAAVVSATGALGILPGVAGAAALGIGTLKVGFAGFGDAMKDAGDPKKFAEDIKGMAPAAQQTATALRDLVNGPLKQLRQNVQQKLFAGMAEEIKGLAGTYLPMLQTQTGRVASTFNVASRSVADFFQKKAIASDLGGALNSVRLGVQNVVLSARPLAQVFVDIFSTSAARVPILTQGIAAAASKFAGFIAAARQSGQLGQWIDKGIQTVKLLGQTVGNVGSILMSVFRSATAEGANLVQKMAEVTGRVADMLKSAKGQDALTAVFTTIRAAVAAVTPVVEALVPLLGTVLVVAGKTLVTVFEALGPPLRDVANALAKSLAPVLPAIAAAFGQIALALIPMVAPVTALIPAFDSIAKVIAEAARVAAEFFTAMANTGAGIFKVIIPLIRDTADVLTALLHIIEPIAPALGVVTAAFLAFKTASAGIAAVQGVLTVLGTKIAEASLNAGVFTEKVTGSAAAGEKLALAGGKLQSGLGLVGIALPIVAAAAVVASVAYERMRDKSDELTASILNGQTTMTAAVAEQSQQLKTQESAWAGLASAANQAGGGMAGLQDQVNSEGAAAARSAQAHYELKAKLEAQLATMGPLEAAQQRVKIAQEEENYQIAQFGPNSQGAITAHGDLVRAKDALKQANDDAAEAEKSLGEKILGTQQIMAGAANADIGYQQSLLTLKSAQSDYTQAVADHGVKSDAAAQADLRLQQAHLSAAAAAAEKAGKEAEAAGVTDTSTIKAQAFKEELLRQAATMTGPSKQALIDLANGTVNAGQTADAARLQSEGYRSQLDLLAKQADGPTKTALENARQKLGEIAASHGTAREKADAQRAMLVELARQTTGPTHDAIMGMIHDLDAVPKNTTFTVTGTGVVGNVIRSTSGSTAPGAGHAAGGVLPGYTPGRDVHTFRSATGGTLHLSGGEAVMRPEWTQAVGVQNVHRMNTAARTGGTHGVRRYMGGYADGGILPTQSFAEGGMVLRGASFRSIPNSAYQGALDALMKTMIPSIVALVKAEEARIAAAAAAAIGGGPVNVGPGGAMSWIIAHESGGRNVPNASGASTASGYFQMINGTWKAYGGSTPRAMQASYAEQVAVATRYVNARYGGWDGAVRYWQAHGNYDQGGYLKPGMTMAMNNTGQRERILSPAETRGYERGGSDALLTELRQLNGTTRMLRGDVDQGGYFAELIGQVRALRAEVASSGRSVTGEAGGARYAAVLGAF